MAEEDCLEFPSFDAFDEEDRPPPPTEEEYPIGCEVELVDIGPARIAQTEELWEPFMDDFFGSGGRRSVRVVRHQGDYTFVICDADPEMIVGCTLYRACFSEPKVRFKKYIPHQLGEVTIPVMGSEEQRGNDNLFEVYESSNEERGREMETRGQEVRIGINTTDPLGTNRRSSQRNVTLLEANCQTPVLQPDANTGGRTLGDVLSRRKYNCAMKKGYEALMSENYALSVRYYTKALKYASDGGVKVFSNRSAAFLGLRNTESAYNDAMHVIQLNPQSILGYVRAGNTLRGMKKYEEARSYYEKALEVEPDNETLKFLIKSDSVLMLYAAKFEHRKVASVVFDRETMNVILISKKNLVAGEMAWTEATNAVTLLCGTGFSDAITGGSSRETLRICGRCQRPLTQIGDFCMSLPELQPSLLATMYNNPGIVECNGHCGVFYCSETCRTKAWAGHHWVECKTSGKWCEAFQQLPGLLKSIVEDHKKSESSNHQVCSPGTRRNSSLTGSSSVQDGINIAVGCVLLACRILACIVSNGHPLVDAIQMYDWMLPQEEKSQGYLKRCSAALLEEVFSGKILTPVYTLLQECFSKEEQEHLSFNFFRHCYKCARYNSIRVRISLWPHIQRKAESYLGLMRMRGFESMNLPTNDSCNGSSTTTEAGGTAATPSTEPRIAQLEKIVNTPAESVAGYFECMALFKVFALAFQPPALQQQQQCGGAEAGEVLPRCNVSVRPVIESAGVIHIAVAENVGKGDQLTADRAAHAIMA